MQEENFAILFEAFVQSYSDKKILDSESAQFDFEFHLTDGLREVKKFLDRIDVSTPETACEDAKALFLFFNDGLNHLIAARRVLLWDVYGKERPESPENT